MRYNDEVHRKDLVEAQLFIEKAKRREEIRQSERDRRGFGYRAGFVPVQYKSAVFGGCHGPQYFGVPE